MLKYWKLLILFVCVMGGVMAVIFRPPVQGVEIAYIADYSPAKDVLSQGMIISSVNGKPIRSVDDWISIAAGISGPVKIKADGKEYALFVDRSNVSDIGIDVINVGRTNLDFGLDIRGGTRVILKPEGENVTKDTIAEVMDTLQTRANLYGLKEMKFFPVQSSTGEYFIQIEAAGVGREIINDLLSKQGKFEAWITKPVDIKDGKGTFQLGDKRYEVIVSEDSIKIGDTEIKEGEEFTLDGIDFVLENRTDLTLFFSGKAYDENDIELIFTDSARSAIIPAGNGFRFFFTVSVSTEGAERFAKITSGTPSRMDLSSGEYYLRDTFINLYLDDQLVSSLRIAASLGGQVYMTPQIEGFRETKEEAIAEKLRLQTILRSGALPVKLETASVSVISPKLGEGFISSAIYAALLAALMVIVVVFLRYRNFRIAIPMIIISLSEVIIILGIAATNDTGVWMTVLIINLIIMGLAWWKKQEIDTFTLIGAVLIPMMGLISWTIDLPAIGGIIAAIGTGIDDMIVIGDETIRSGRKKEKLVLGIKEKIKRAFFIIFGSAATTIAAMVPLMSIGVGLIRSFAITTIIGVLVGILITRPAYAKIIEMTLGKK